MTDVTTQNPAATSTDSKTPKVKTVTDNMKSRVIFPTSSEALTYLHGLGSTLSDFDKYPVAAPGVNDSGEFDPTIYTDSMEVMVSKLSKKGGGAKAIVVAPLPTLDSLLANDEGKSFVAEIIRKELNHRAVRALRDADDVLSVVDQMPTTLNGYIESGRGDGGIMATFDELYKQINTTLSAKLPIWAKRRFIKSEMRKAMESKGYALEFFGPLEEYGPKKESLFEVAIKLGIAAAKAKSFDSTIFDRWLETRATKTFTADETDDSDDLDIDALTDSMLEDDKTEEPAPVAAPDGTTPETPAA